MEYPMWRKKSNTPQFLNFVKSYRLEPPPLEESSNQGASPGSAMTTASTTTTTNIDSTVSTTSHQQQQQQQIAAVTAAASHQRLSVVSTLKQPIVVVGITAVTTSTPLAVTLTTTTKMVTNTTTTTVGSSLPIGAEIKIPGVGVTPVAVSTTLPAAVVQLSQQGLCFCFFFHIICLFNFINLHCFPDFEKYILTHYRNGTARPAPHYYCHIRL